MLLFLENFLNLATPEVGLYKRKILRKSDRRFRPRKKEKRKKKRKKTRFRPRKKKKSRSRPRKKKQVERSYFFLL